MSLHSQPRDLIVVRRRDLVTGSAGEQEPGPPGDPIEVRCNVYPMDAFETGSEGDLTNVERRQVKIHTGKPWPGDQYAELTHDGSVWIQDGPVVTYGKGMNTRHQRVIINRVGPARG